MNILDKALIVSVVATMSTSVVWAGNVTIPNTFTSGTPAVAAEVNENFNALETEVDDNDSRITSNDNRISALETPKTSYLSVHPSAFQLWNPSTSGCSTSLSLSHMAFVSGTGCAVYAPVSLPHGATVDAVSCYFWDNSTAHSISSWTLYAHSKTSYNSAATVAAVNNVTTDVYSSTVAVESVAIPTVPHDVDNSLYNYTLTTYLSTTAGSLDLDARILGCEIEYTL